jgi:hypothetical protein
MAFEQGVNSNNVFVGNLAWATSIERLREHFGHCGNVINAEVKYGRDGRSRGCGVVEFDSPQASATAINTLNETELDGRQIFVREDRDTPKPAGRVAAPKANGPRPAAAVSGAAAHFQSLCATLNCDVMPTQLHLAKKYDFERLPRCKKLCDPLTPTLKVIVILFFWLIYDRNIFYKKELNFLRFFFST